MVKKALLCKHSPVLWEETAGCRKVIKCNITYAVRPQSTEGIFPTAVRQIEVETQDEIFEILTPLVCLLALWVYQSAPTMRGNLFKSQNSSSWTTFEG